MVAPAAFPLAKLGALLLKQVSKPIANIVKNQAKTSPVFSKYVCKPPAIIYNWCEVKMKMWLLNMGQPVQITVLNDAGYVSLGAELLGEGIIFIIAAGILLSEYSKSARKEAAKEEAKLAELERIQNALRDLFLQSEEQAAHIRELTRKVADIDPNKGHYAKTYVPEEYEVGPPKHELPEFLLPKPSDKGTDGKDGPSAEDAPPTEEAPSNGELTEKPDKMEANYGLLRGVIFRGLSNFDKDFGFDSDRQRNSGVINAGLDHLYQNVYRIPIKF